ncbi:c-type cytochrome [Allomesorhizobium alhagi]|uniref:Cytochrome c domain-containing protein n=1 Tax=Mesorhizobium alhagi CCNWXJ12-2 TaxID=1107882 RepID=H0I3D1_9HYPH|nr:c-type cytochrome [Mesorhizobium alhagi]EHK52527.1 hypothetical protein MAXJ12_34979 [Mesorhizobium alhagi CCNWXJ12-2]
MKKFILAVAFSFVLLSDRTGAQEKSYGQVEYLNSCASCHGDSGKGDGPLAGELKTAPANLTRLAERNGGEFPYSHVFAVIDGRYVVPGHGDREMPVWGRRFLQGDWPIYGPVVGEAVTQERIHELARYVQALQR